MHRYAEDIEERKENLYSWRMTDQAKYGLKITWILFSA